MQPPEPGPVDRLEYLFLTAEGNPRRPQRLVDQEWFTDEVDFRHARSRPFPAVLRISAVIAEHEVLVRTEAGGVLGAVLSELGVVDVAIEHKRADVQPAAARASRTGHLTSPWRETGGRSAAGKTGLPLMARNTRRSTKANSSRCVWLGSRLTPRMTPRPPRSCCTSVTRPLAAVQRQVRPRPC